MNIDDVGKYAVIIVSDNETVKGIIKRIIDIDLFEIESSNGMISRWNQRQIKGIKFKGGA